MIQNIIFDIGGVLAYPQSGNWFITPNFWEIIEKQKIEEEELQKALKKYLYLQTQEPKTEEEEYQMFSNYYDKVLKEINYPQETKEFSNKLAEDCVYNDDKFIFYEDVLPVLKELSSKYNLYIISNGWPSSIRVLKNKKIETYFKKIYISSFFSSTKEENLFDIFIKENKEIIPENTLFIDDRRHIIDKAEEYHLQSILMDRENKYAETKYKTIKTLYEIKKVVR